MGFSDNVALLSAEGRLTFSEMIDEADSLIGRCEERSLLFLVATNTIPAVLGYVGCIRNRVVPVMLCTNMDDALLVNLVEAYQPQYWWVPEDFVERYRAVIDAVRIVCKSRGYVLLASGTVASPMHSDLGLLLTTSGSTGTPKLVRLTYQNLAANAESIAKYQGITQDDRAITTLPFSYSYGISIVNSHLLRGASVVLTEESILTREFWECLKRTKATHFGGVPYTYAMLERLHFEEMDLPSLRYISQAGGRLGERLQEHFGRICESKGIRLFIMYGQTEATARMSWLPPEYALSKLGSIGIAIPGGSFRLIDGDSVAIEGPNEIGELVYEGENVSLGYACSLNDLALPDENEGVLKTGDMAKRDYEGFYYIVGRLKRFLKIYGNRVNLDEVEKLFTTETREIACVGADDFMRVFVTSSDVDRLRREIMEVTKLNPRAFKIDVIAELPRTTTGKLDYAALERLC